MSCITSTTTSQCTPCIHPIDYLFKLVEDSTLNNLNQENYPSSIDYIIDRGYVNTNCNLCCPGCSGVYVLASVETFLKFAELVQLVSVTTCCNGFNECVEELIVDLSDDPNTVLSILQIKDRILDKGIVEYGNIVNNCTKESYGTEICRVKDFLLELNETTNQNDSALWEIWDRLVDKGIAILCYQNIIVIGSVETVLKWIEAIGFPIPITKTCCSNIYSSVETYSKYIETLGIILANMENKNVENETTTTTTI